ncbi:MAG: hypothetical protein HKP25_10130 [Marinicaulis sp.]|nr:hypothetical protein [Marinicaulis sp.]
MAYSNIPNVWSFGDNKIIFGAVAFLLSACGGADQDLAVERVSGEPPPMRELGAITEFCRNNAGIKIYKPTNTDRLNVGGEGCTNSTCMRLLATNQIGYVEGEVRERSDGEYYFLSAAPGPGKYRFSLADNGDPNCDAFERIRDFNRTNANDRMVLPVPNDKCIAAEPIAKFSSGYEYRTINSNPDTKNISGEKITYKKSVIQLVDTATDDIVAESIAYDIYLGTRYLSYGAGTKDDGVGLLKCQGNGSVAAFLNLAISPN